MNSVQTQKIIRFSTDVVVGEQQADTHSAQFLNGINVSGLAISRLVSKENVWITSLRNMSSI